MNTNSFPALGEIIKFLFDATGILALKGNKDAVIEDETSKKSIQKALVRLSQEEGELGKNLNELSGLFFDCLNKILGSERLAAVIDESLWEIFVQYSDLVKREGTYLSKKETIKWLIRRGFLHNAIFSPVKNLARFNIVSLGLSYPEEEFWFLPSIENDKIIWSFSKALRWMYEITETSLTDFHYPNKAADFAKSSENKSNNKLNRNLENASKWLNNRSFPTWNAIDSNLKDSFSALEKCNDSSIQKVIDPKIQQSITVVLFVARFTTFIAQQIEEKFGKEFLYELVILYKTHSSYLHEEIENMKAFIEYKIKKKNISDANKIDLFWDTGVRYYCSNKNQRVQAFAIEMQSFYKINGYDAKIPEDVKKSWIDKYGSFLVMQAIDAMQYQSTVIIPSNFPELCMKGIDMKSKSDIHESEIIVYESELKNAKLDEVLSWLAFWIRANFDYRKENHDAAYQYYKKAFDIAKYRAGQMQYTLVNQYIESCAKADKWRDFKKGIAWANYLGIEVRWLRVMDDESDETLRATFELFKKIRYAV